MIDLVKKFRSHDALKKKIISLSEDISDYFEILGKERNSWYKKYNPSQIELVENTEDYFMRYISEFVQYFKRGSDFESSINDFLKKLDFDLMPIFSVESTILDKKNVPTKEYLSQRNELHKELREFRAFYNSSEYRSKFKEFLKNLLKSNGLI